MRKVSANIFGGRMFFTQTMRLLAFLFLSTAVFAQTEADFLTGTRQLTFEGKRSGEGYFSADGTKMIFQSEREEGVPEFHPATGVQTGRHGGFCEWGGAVPQRAHRTAAE